MGRHEIHHSVSSYCPELRFAGYRRCNRWQIAAYADAVLEPLVAVGDDVAISVY